MEGTLLKSAPVPQYWELTRRETREFRGSGVLSEGEGFFAPPKSDLALENHQQRQIADMDTAVYE